MERNTASNALRDYVAGLLTEGPTRNLDLPPHKRKFVQVLRLLEIFTLEFVHEAVQEALRLGAFSYDAVKHLTLARIERRPARLDIDRYPHLPAATV